MLCNEMKFLANASRLGTNDVEKGKYKGFISLSKNKNPNLAGCRITKTVMVQFW